MPSLHEAIEPSFGVAMHEAIEPSFGRTASTYCKSTIFGRYKIWWIYYILSDNRGFSLYNPI